MGTAIVALKQEERRSFRLVGPANGIEIFQTALIKPKFTCGDKVCSPKTFGAVSRLAFT